MLRHSLVKLPGNIAAHLRGQRCKSGAGFQFLGIFRKVHTHRSEIVCFTGHGVPEDHRRAIRVQRPLGITVVFERLTRASDGPFLRSIHNISHARRNRQVPLQWIPFVLAYPAADFGVGLIGRTRIGIVIKRGVPTVGADFADAVPAVLHVFPKCRYVFRIGQNGSRPHDGDRSIICIFHDDAPSRVGAATGHFVVAGCQSHIYECYAAATTVCFAARS